MTTPANNVSTVWQLPKAFYDRYPSTLTFLTTYRCNAQCTQCCFESNPNIAGQLTLNDMLLLLDEAVQSFPALKLVVFSGGECFLLADDLISTISAVHQRGLLSRCVSNGFWGKDPSRAKSTALRLRNAGVTEINFSTGLEHQQWVPLNSVLNATEALIAEGVNTLITVESDSATSSCFADLSEGLRSRGLSENPLVGVRCNSWMMFRAGGEARSNWGVSAAAYVGCDQVFDNVVVTPYKKLSACCGLTLEHINEMRLGDLNDDPRRSVADMYWAQLDDFLKIWIHMDGPHKILEKLYGDGIRHELDKLVHKCHACALMHNNPEIRRRLSERHLEFVPDILNRFLSRTAVLEVEQSQIRRVIV